MQPTEIKLLDRPSRADRFADRVIAALLVIVALAAIGVSRKFPSTGLVTDIGSARFPILYASVLILLCVLLFWQKLHAKSPNFSKDDLPAHGQEDSRPLRSFLGVLLSVGCAWLIPTSGYAISVILFLTLMMRLLGRRKWWLNVVLSLAITSVLYAVFSLGLGVPLPVGAWFE